MSLTLILLPLALAAVVDAASGGLSDPTRPVDYLPATAAAAPLPDEMVDWRLTAVRIGATGRSAVLNGRMVRTGDVLGRARIIEIRPGTVVVEYDRRQVEVRLHGVGVKKKSTQTQEEPVQQ